MRRLEKPRKRREAREGQKARKAGKKEREKREYTAKEERSAPRIIASDHRGVNGCYWAYHTYTYTHVRDAMIKRETHVETGRHVSTRRMHDCVGICEGQGDDVAQMAREREREREGERER